ncbi:hypothetical protein [Pedobacter paludis]|nr:hypothetical protein [Pedobacter paludis]
MKKLQKITRKTVFIFKSNGSKAMYSTDPTETMSTSISGGNIVFIKKN